jgi:enoyl-[acyl-carrier protein] reductase I
MREKIKYMDVHAPLRRAVDQSDVGRSALYFCSDLSSGVTGEIHYVDGGFSTIVNV